MRKWIKYIAAAFFLIAALPMSVAAAEQSKGVLTADKNDVSVALNLPEGKTETITSLRLKVRVHAGAGTMGEPSFRFDESIKSAVRDAEIKKEADGSYSVDIILSGKKDQAVFQGSEYAKIGTLSLKPTSAEYQMNVEFAGAGKEDEPSVKYMDAGGFDELTAYLENAKTLEVKNEKAGAQKPSKKKWFEMQPTLNVYAKRGSKKVNFEWSKVEEADGYVLYEYNAKTKKYKQIKEIKKASVTSTSKLFKLASSHAFTLRAYKLKPVNEPKHGAYSTQANVTLSPDKVKGISRKGKSKSILSWKKVSNAKGYQVWCRKKKGGKFKLVKTINKVSVTKYNLKKLNKKNYQFKVRAFVLNSKKKPVYGVFSAVR